MNIEIVWNGCLDLVEKVAELGGVVAPIALAGE
jgi:hypothetical protein